MPLTLLQKSSVLDAWQGSEYASEIPLAFKSQMSKVEFIRIEKIILVLSSSEKRTSLFFWYFDKVLLVMLN